MARDDKYRDLKAAIRKHLALNGPSNWDEFQSDWPDVSRSTLFRIIKAVRDEITSDVASSDSPEALELARKRIRSIPEPIRVVQDETGRQIPTAPSPRIVAKLGDKGRVHLDLMSRYDVLWSDYIMMREYSMKPDPQTGELRIKNPMVFERAMRNGLAITEAQLRAVADVYNMQEIGELYTVVMEEIGKASPDVQHAILCRLRAMNNKLAMTVDASVP